jgi:hypothetical protein
VFRRVLSSYHLIGSRSLCDRQSPRKVNIISQSDFCSRLWCKFIPFSGPGSSSKLWSDLSFVLSVCPPPPFPMYSLPATQLQIIFGAPSAHLRAVPMVQWTTDQSAPTRKKFVGCRQWHFHPYTNFINPSSQPNLLFPLVLLIWLLS